jgi:hypothetical protein
MNRWKSRPVLEELNPRTLPSTLTLTPPTGAPPPHAAGLTSHALHGAGTGTYTRPLMPDSGDHYDLHGRITLTGLGEFRVSGWVNGTGFTSTGRATGHLELTNARGKLTLELHSGMLPGFSPVPRELVYSIQGGTGAYAAVKGYGVAGVSFTPLPNQTDFPMKGTFRLSFS